jgi:sulfur carrier protein
MTITVNGDAAELPDRCTLGELVRIRIPDARGVAAAVNGVVVPRARHEALVLAEGDRVEIVTAVQGG